MCVGEGGMDPQYFAHTLTLYEANLFLRGMARRQQQQWEVARYMAFYSAWPHCKNFTFDKMGQFPWEKKVEAAQELSTEEQEREIEALRARARARDEEWLKQQNNGR